MGILVALCLWVVSEQHQNTPCQVSGLAEPIRLSFVVAGIPFKDTTPLTDPEFNDRKLALHPYAPDAAGLPILVFDGKAGTVRAGRRVAS